MTRTKKMLPEKRCAKFGETLLKKPREENSRNIYINIPKKYHYFSSWVFERTTMDCGIKPTLSKP